MPSFVAISFDLFKFDTPLNLVYGLAVGLVFGFLLQRATLTRFDTIVGQFLWRDHTMLRTMLTALVVGAVGVWTMHQMWNVPLHLKPAHLAANAVGGLIFGIGMTILGFCPGTGVAALGDGSRHAIPGLIGMLVGAGLFAEVHPALKDNLLTWATVGAESKGKITLMDVTGLSPWVFVIALGVVSLIVFALLRGKDRPSPSAE